MFGIMLQQCLQLSHCSVLGLVLQQHLQTSLHSMPGTMVQLLIFDYGMLGIMLE